MAIDWNTRLPIAVISPYSNSEGQKVRRNDVETGPARFELLSEHGPASATISWFFTPIEMQLFEGWYNHELIFGAESFIMQLKVGAGLLDHEIYFLSPPANSLKGKKWIVKAKVMMVEKQYDTLSDYNTLKANNPPQV